MRENIEGASDHKRKEISGPHSYYAVRVSSFVNLIENCTFACYNRLKITGFVE